MIQKTKKIVLFLPHRADPTRGEIFSADLLPLELLQIATGPVAAGPRRLRRGDLRWVAWCRWLWIDVARTLSARC